MRIRSIKYFCKEADKTLCELESICTKAIPNKITSLCANDNQRAKSLIHFTRRYLRDILEELDEV